MIKIFETGSSSRGVAGFRVSNHAPQTFFSGRGTSSRKLRFPGTKLDNSSRKKERKKIIRKSRERGAGPRIWTLKSWRIFLYGGIRRRINDCVGKSRLVCGNLFHFATRLAPSPYFRPSFDARFIFPIPITSFLCKLYFSLSFISIQTLRLIFTVIRRNKSLASDFWFYHDERKKSTINFRPSDRKRVWKIVKLWFRERVIWNWRVSCSGPWINSYVTD